MRSHDDVVTVKRLGTLNDAVGHGPDVLMHFVRDPGGVQQAARRPQGIFALLVLVALDLARRNKLADIAPHCRLDIEKVNPRLQTFGAGGDQVVHCAQRALRSIDRYKDNLHFPSLGACRYEFARRHRACHCRIMLPARIAHPADRHHDPTADDICKCAGRCSRAGCARAPDSGFRHSRAID
jgi:hypothetical protein